MFSININWIMCFVGVLVVFAIKIHTTLISKDKQVKKNSYKKVF